MAAHARPAYASGALYPAARGAARAAAAPGRTARRLLVGIGFVLMAAPLTRVYVGALPVNLIDVLAVGIYASVWIGAVRPVSLGRSSPVVGLVAVYAMFIVGSVIRELTVYSLVLEPVYVLLRLAVGLSMVAVLPYVIRRRVDLDAVLKASLVGVCVSAVVAVLYALPPFGLLRLYLNEGSVFFPGRAAANLEKLAAAAAERASSPIGDPNISGSFFVLWMPLALMAWRTRIWGRGWSLFAMAATVLLASGALVTYGRSTVLALVMVAFVVMAFRLFRSSVTMGALVVVALGFVLTVGMASTQFDFALLVGKFERMMEDPTMAHTDRARFASYEMILPFLEENPMWAVTGLGVMGTRGVRLGAISADDLVWRTTEGEIHSMFAAPFFHYGLAAMLVLTALALVCGLRAAAMSLRREGSPYLPYWQWLFAAWVGLVPYWLFTHVYVTTEQGHFFLFFLVGLTVTLGQLDPAFRARRLLRRRWVTPEASGGDASGGDASGGELPGEPR